MPHKGRPDFKATNTRYSYWNKYHRHHPTVTTPLLSTQTPLLPTQTPKPAHCDDAQGPSIFCHQRPWHLLFGSYWITARRKSGTCLLSCQARDSERKALATGYIIDTISVSSDTILKIEAKWRERSYRYVPLPPLACPCPHGHNSMTWNKRNMLHSKLEKLECYTGPFCDMIKN